MSLPNQEVYDRAMRQVEEMAKEYGAPGVPERIRLKAQAVLGAGDAAEAERLAQKAVASAQVAYLAAWAAGKIPGKVTAQNADQRAKRAEGLAEYLESIGEGDAAQRQRERAEKLRAQGRAAVVHSD